MFTKPNAEFLGKKSPGNHSRNSGTSHLSTGAESTMFTSLASSNATVHIKQCYYEYQCSCTCTEYIWVVGNYLLANTVDARLSKPLCTF